MDFKEYYFDVWMLAWNFHKKYTMKMNKGINFWEEAVSESIEILKKYTGKPQQEFLKRLLTATLSELQMQDMEN